MTASVVNYKAYMNGPRRETMTNPTDSDDTPSGRGEEDRRLQKRHVTTFRACRVESGDKAHIGIVRNISPSGAQIESKLDLAVGLKLTYCWDGIPPIEAEVVWREGDRIGVRNLLPVEGWNSNFPPRAVRIPSDLTCRVWQGDHMHQAAVANISQTGMRCEGDLDLDTGLQVTVEIGPLVVPNTTVRWCADGVAGLRFGSPIRMAVLMSLLSSDNLSNIPMPGKQAS